MSLQLLGLVRVSGFGFLSAFGLRISDFRLGRPVFLAVKLLWLRHQPRQVYLRQSVVFFGLVPA
jgi:hypothetical protein